MKIIKSILLISFCLIANNLICMDEKEEKAFRESLKQLPRQRLSRVRVDLMAESKRLESQLQKIDLPDHEKKGFNDRLKPVQLKLQIVLDEISRIADAEHKAKKQHLEKMENFKQMFSRLEQIPSELTILNLKKEKTEDEEKKLKDLQAELESLIKGIKEIGLGYMEEANTLRK